MTEQEKIKLLAVEVMEWEQGGNYWVCGPDREIMGCVKLEPYDPHDEPEYILVWNPFRHIEHAWMLIEKLEARYEVKIGSHLGDNAWHCLFIPEEGLSLPWLYGEAEDVCVAISEAALETIK